MSLASDTTALAAPDDAERRDMVRMVRTVIASTVAAVTIAFALITGGILLVHDDVATAVWVGTFTAFWGGGGFGVMAGIAIHNLRVERVPTRA